MRNKQKGGVGVILVLFIAFWLLGAYTGYNPYARQNKETGNLEVNFSGFKK